MSSRILFTFVMAGCLATTIGCASTVTSNTARTAKEQLLLSNAVDRSLQKVDFSPLNGQNVFIDEKYLDCVDKPYIVGSIRHRVMRAGGHVVAKAEDAGIVMEMRSGGVGTDTSESFLGTPEIALPGMLTIPEIRLVERKSQFGYAKIGLVLYEAGTNTILGDGGVSMAQADDNNTFYFGIGPFQNGSLGRSIDQAVYTPRGSGQRALPTTVAFGARGGQFQEPDIQFASGSRVMK